MAPNPSKQPSSEIVTYVNDKLYSQGHQHIKLSAAKWTSKGNLVLTAHHTVTQAQLTNTTSTITSFLREAYPQYFSVHSTLQARANVKWSKLLINSVPTGVCETRGPWTPDECHRALIAHNPSYSALKITQKPSWVRKPTTYKSGDLSSLVIAFEDPDGSLRRSLLASRQLFLLGVRAKVSRWKELPHTAPNAPPPPASPSPSFPELSSPDEEELAIKERAILDHVRRKPASSAHLQSQQPTAPTTTRPTRSRKTKA